MRSLALAAALTAAALTASAEEGAAKESAESPHPLAMIYGTWTGTARGVGPDRQPYSVVQTERAGPMLDGEIAVIEGRGYAADGTIAFNAFATVSCAEDGASCRMHSYANGREGSFDLVPTDSGFEWTIPAGPGARVVYTATISGDTWTEIGRYHPAEGEPVETFRMEVTRTGDTSWPAAGAVLPPAPD